MDALISTSFPFLSLFAVPLLTNYTTSLNLLFFYLTWSTLLLSHSPLKVEFLGTLAVRLLFYLLPSYLFLGFDCLAPSVSVATKEHGEVGVASSAEHGKRGMWKKVAGWATVNVLLGVGVQAGVEVLLIHGLHVRSALKITTTLPFPYAVVKDLVKVFAGREVCFLFWGSGGARWRWVLTLGLTRYCLTRFTDLRSIILRPRYASHIRPGIIPFQRLIRWLHITTFPLRTSYAFSCRLIYQPCSSDYISLHTFFSLRSCPLKSCGHTAGTIFFPRASSWAELRGGRKDI